MALSDAFNAELHDLADAGCPVIQLEEPQIHLLAARGYKDPVITPAFMLQVFNNTVKGLRAKTEVWCHTCWGNPSQQRMFGSVQSYKPALDAAQSGGRGCDHVRDEELEPDGPGGRRGGDHGHEGVRGGDRPPHAAGGVAGGGGGADSAALKVIPAERLVLSSDCGMGREGMSRRHAFYKMVALVQGTNLVKKELGLPVTESLGADPKFSLIRTRSTRRVGRPLPAPPAAGHGRAVNRSCSAPCLRVSDSIGEGWELDVGSWALGVSE